MEEKKNPVDPDTQRDLTQKLAALDPNMSSRKHEPDPWKCNPAPKTYPA